MTSSSRTFLFLLFLAFLACLSYSNTFSVPFALDDLPRIALDPEIWRTWTYADLSNSRYVGFLTFALNYRFGGLDVFGYHLVNLLIHIANGCLVYALIRLLFRASDAEDAEDGRSDRAAAVAALLFVAHPLQTQAVTYIVQRFTSLATLFFLVGVSAYVKSRLTDGKKWGFWYAVSLVATVLAMKTKEIAFTLPFMILLVEAVFFRTSGTRRWIRILPFLATLAIIPLSSLDGLRTSDIALGEAEAVPRLNRSDYLLTQFRVIVTYLRLLVLPLRQNLDYDYPTYQSFWDPAVFGSSLFLLVLVLSAIILARRKEVDCKMAGFGGLWFFLALSSESSIVPIPDVIFEHRVYLPSVGLFLIAGLILNLLKPKAVRFLLLGTVVLALSAATYQRNRVWGDMVTLWEDVVRKSPNKARGHYNLGWAYRDKDRLEDAAREYRTALRLQPDLSEAHNNLGNVYQRQGRPEEAIREYQTALRLKPDNFRIHNNLGVLYAAQGRLDEAIQEFLAALRLHPDSVDAHRNLGLTYSSQGRQEEATREFERAREVRDKWK